MRDRLASRTEANALSPVFQAVENEANFFDQFASNGPDGKLFCKLKMTTPR